MPSELKSETGMVTCYPSLAQSYINQLQDFVSNSEAIKRNLKRKSANIISSLNNLSQELLSFSEEVNRLSQLQSSLAEVLPTQAVCHREIYSTVSGMLKQWAGYEANMAGVVNEYLTNFFKYRYTEMTSLGELLKEREEFRDVYLKAEGKLRARKERLWAHKDQLDKWQLDLSRSQIPTLLDNKSLALANMLPIDTLHVKHLRDMYGFLHYQTHADSAKLLAETTQIESLHFADMARVYDEKTQTLCVAWREVIMKLSEFFPRSQAYEL